MSKSQTCIEKVQKKVEPLHFQKQEPIRQLEPDPAQSMSPQAAYQRARVSQSGLRPADLLALQRAAGNRRMQQMVGRHSDSAGDHRASSYTNLVHMIQSDVSVARTPDETIPGSQVKVPAMTPEDMYNKVIAARGFEEHIPVHELEATRKKLETMRADIEKNPSPKLRSEYRTLLNRYNLSRLGGAGAAAGKGYNTYAIIQVVDKDGKIVATAMGKYTGRKHAEEIAVTLLRNKMKGTKLPDGRMEVVGDKKICTERCRPTLIDFAKEYGLEKIEGHVFRREKLVGSGEASEKTTARTVTTQSSEGKSLTRNSEVIYSRSGASVSSGEPQTGQVAGKSKPTPAKPSTKEPTPTSSLPAGKTSGKTSKVVPSSSVAVSEGKVRVKAAIARVRLATPLLGLLGILLAGWYLEKVKRKEQKVSFARQTKALELELEKQLKGPIIQNGIRALRALNPGGKLYVYLTITVEATTTLLGQFGPFFYLRAVGVSDVEWPRRDQQYQPVFAAGASKARTDVSFTVPLEVEERSEPSNTGLDRSQPES